MNRKIVMLTMLIAVLFLASACATGQSYTEDEKYSREIGNKSHIMTITATYAATALMTYYQLFRTSSAITVNKVGIRTGAGTGSFVGFPIRIGIMNVDSAGFLTTWCGATGNAKNDWEPTFSAWNEITLNEVAPLADNTMYALVFEDYQGAGYLSAARRFYYYPMATPNAGFETVRGLDASIESRDSFVTKTTAGVYSFAYSLLGWYARDSTVAGYGPDAYQGVSYGAVTGRVCYNQYSFSQLFYQSDTQTVDRFSLEVINNGLGVSHADELHVELYDSSNNLLFSGARDNNMYHASSIYTWYDYEIDPPIQLATGSYWFKVWSTCASTTTGYTIASLALLDAAGSLHQSLTYQGDTSYVRTTTDNGSSWTAVKISDLIFKFRLIPSITTYENPMNASGMHQTAYNSLSYNYDIWANYTGYNALNFIEDLVNASGTHQVQWTGTAWNIWNNYTGATTPLFLFQNLLNALGTHTYVLNDAGYFIYANYTGTGIGDRINVYGTEYSPGEPGTIYAQILYEDGTPSNVSSPTVTIWEKTNKYVDTASMIYIPGSNGCYYYNFIVPSNISVFLTDVKSDDPVAYWSGGFHVSEWSSAIPYINDTVNHINGTVNSIYLMSSYINNTYNPLIQATLNDLYSLCLGIDYNVSNINVTVDFSTIYGYLMDIYNISQYMNNTIWGSYIVSDIMDVINYINDTQFDGYNLSEIYNITAGLENVILDINTTTSSLSDKFEVRLTNFGQITPPDKYLAQVTVFNSTGAMINADSTPKISLYDTAGNLIVNDASMIWSSKGQYTYSYTTVIGQPTGQWTTVTKTTVDGVQVKNVGYWKLELNPPEVTASILNTCIPKIGGLITITNEGGSNQEYTYSWWVTPRVNGAFTDSDTISAGTASKLIAPLETFSIVKSLNVPSAGIYWFKVRVYYGTQSSASVMFNATDCKANGNESEFSGPGEGGGGIFSGATNNLIPSWAFIGMVLFASIMVIVGVGISLRKKHKR